MDSSSLDISSASSNTNSLDTAFMGESMTLHECRAIKLQIDRFYNSLRKKFKKTKTLKTTEIRKEVQKKKIVLTELKRPIKKQLRIKRARPVVDFNQEQFANIGDIVCCYI